MAEVAHQPAPLGASQENASAIDQLNLKSGLDILQSTGIEYDLDEFSTHIEDGEFEVNEGPFASWRPEVDDQGLVVRNVDGHVLYHRKTAQEETDEKEDQEKRRKMLEDGAFNTQQQREIPNEIMELWKQGIPLIRTRFQTGYQRSIAEPALKQLDQKFEQVAAIHDGAHPDEPSWKMMRLQWEAWHVQIDAIKKSSKELKKCTPEQLKDEEGALLRYADQLRFAVEVHKIPFKLLLTPHMTRTLSKVLLAGNHLKDYSDLASSLNKATVWEQAILEPLRPEIEAIIESDKAEEKTAAFQRYQLVEVKVKTQLTKDENEWGLPGALFLNMDWVFEYGKALDNAKSEEDKQRCTLDFLQAWLASLEAAGLSHWTENCEIKPTPEMITEAVTRSLKYRAINEDPQDQVVLQAQAAPTTQPELIQIPSVHEKTNIELAQRPLAYINGLITSYGYVEDVVRAGNGGARIVVNVGTEARPCYIGMMTNMFGRGAAKKLFHNTDNPEGQPVSLEGLSDENVKDITHIAQFPTNCARPVRKYRVVWKNIPVGKQVPKFITHSDAIKLQGVKTMDAKYIQLIEQHDKIWDALAVYRQKLTHPDTMEKLKEEDIENQPWLFNLLISH